MRPISAILPGVLANIAAATELDLSTVPFTQRPLFIVEGPKVLDRRTRRWMTVDQATQELMRLASEMAVAEDPGLIIPVSNALAWAIRDAREAENDPLPPAAMARAA
ncbi:hypothetical protein [Brevundimonas vesicularis]|uniref:Uncharacterized protein n=1 Tax=Brevundimonas vesicularis TaxID=41276 RepID=A0ABU4KNJ0_BREVE|nr:hypothetical protein [Brevundimonas vesicularis]MDX2334583.1 hypothetical protein [Brevundimonas vesicularis]